MKTTLLRNRRGADDVGSFSKKWKSFGPLGQMKFALLLLLLVNLFFTHKVSAQIALRGTSVATTTNRTLTIAKPSGLTVGDVMLAQVMQSGTDGSAFVETTFPSGWAVIASSAMNPSGNSRYRATILYKVATATDVAAASFSFGLDADSDDGQGGISAFSGVDIAGGVNENGVAGGPFDLDPSNAYNNIANDGQLNANGITTVTANSAVIFFGMMANDTNGENVSATNPTSWSELYDEDFNNANLDTGIISSWGTRTTAGATGNASSNLGAPTTNGALLIALRRFTGTITTGTVTGPICAGSNIAVPYTITGTYATGNVFTAQLSNSSGSFASPIAIGTATATTAGSISATIPAGQGAGSSYRIRVVSNFPPATGSDNGVDLSIVVPATATAGAAFNACATATNIAITTGASSANNAGILWTSNGTGTINNPTSISTATYTPGVGEASTVTFTLTATGNSPCSNASSNKVMTFVQPPTATAGGSKTVCSNQTAVLTSGEASSSNGTIAWTENGTGNITAGSTTLTPTYTPGAGENGTVTLTMTVTNATCGSVQATYTVNVVAAATASAGPAVSMCTNGGTTVIGTGATATNNTGVTWTSNGTGTIGNANSLNGATYTPGIGETGNVTLTLTATGNTPCGNATNNKTLTINAIPQATGVTICAGQSGSLTSSTVCPLGASISSGPNTSGTAVNLTGVGSTAWTSPGNITTAGTPYATVALGILGTSNYIKATNYGFGIPANATIAGISVAVNRQASSTSFGMSDNEVRMIKNNVIIGTDKGVGTTWPTALTVANYGGVTDLWGTTWNPSDINNGNFGVALSVTTQGNRTATVDYIRVTVSYQLPGDLNWYTASSGGTFLGSGSSFNPVGVAGSGLADTSNNTNAPIVVTYYVECATVEGCRTPVDFTINPLPTVSFTGFSGSYCGTPASITLTGNQAPAGTFSGAGITDNADGTATFNPAAAGPGSHPIVYSYTDGNTCTNTDTQNVTVIAPTTYYADADGDGFGDPAVTELSCAGPSVGFVANNTDCDDNALQYLDADGDGFGSTTQVACGVSNNTDCDDAVLNYADVDGDGFGSDTFVNCGGVLNTDDCDDNLLLYTDVDGDGFGSDTLVACGGVSNTLDCDDNAIQYLDADGDGFGSTTQVACGVLNNTDCNDNDNTMNTTFPFYADADGDAYGAGSLVSVCAVDALTPPTGYSLDGTDCNDADNTVYQNGTLYVDADGDGYSTNVTQVVCYGATVPAGYVAAPTILDCNDTVSAINPGQAEVLYNGIDDNCDGNLDEGNLLTTSLLAGSCGTTLASIGSLIGITTVPGHPISGYRIRVTNGAQVQIIEKAAAHFTMPELSSYEYATTYTVDIELQRAGVWLGYYGATCQVSTPAVLAEGGAASVSPSQCGITLEKINTLIATTSLQGVTGYRFRVTNLTDPLGPNAVQVLDRSQNWFSLQMLTRYNYGTTYRIEVAVKSTGDYGGYGAPCEINSPASPSITNYCGTAVPSKTTAVAASSLAGITQYRFQVTRQLDNAASTIDRGVNWFNFNMVPALIYTSGATYTVRVAVMTSGTWSPFGDACEVTAPNAAKGVPTTAPVVEAQQEFKVAAYPNPFTADFNIDVTTSSQENVELKVYDMLGKLIETKQINAAELNTAKVGAQYPSGVYNVIVNQDGIVKTLRVIKR